MDRKRPGETAHDNPGLGHRIVARYRGSPGVIRMEAMQQRFRRTALFGHDRLPMLTRLSRHWGGSNLPYPGSGGPLTFLQRSPFAPAEFAGAERIGRSAESVSTTRANPEAPLSVLDTPRGPLRIAREAGKRMISRGSTTPAAPAATESGPAVVRHRKSQPEALSTNSQDATPARHTGAIGTATAATVATPADSRTPGPLPLSPTDTGLGRAIIRRRRHPSPEASNRTTASVTTETGPPLRIGPQFRKEESSIRRTALPLPVAGERRPSTHATAPASPVSAPRLVSPDRPSGTADTPRSEPVRREEPSSIAPPAAIAAQGDIGTAIRSRHANTTIATSAGPLPVSTAQPRQSRPSRVDRSEAEARVPDENRPGTSTTNAPETITARSLTMARGILGPRAATSQSPAEQWIVERGPVDWSRPADRLPSTAPPPHPTVLPMLAENAHREAKAPETRIGSTDTLSLARSPMPLVVQRQPQHHSAGQTPREQSPATAWPTGNAGRLTFADGGHGAGSATTVSIDELGVGTDTAPNPPQAGAGERTNVDDLVDKVLRKLIRRLTVEQERRGRQRWF